MIEAIQSRLETGIALLNGRVRGAGDFAALMQRGSLPSAPVFAHVLYAGLVPAGAPDVMTGAYRQQVREAINVVLTIRSNDADGQRAMDTVKDLQGDVLAFLCGWAPDTQTGVFQLARSAMVSFRKGTLVWQIDLTINDQLRIIS